MQSGLLPLSQEAIICGDVSYFDFKGAVNDNEESDRVARALGPRNKVCQSAKMFMGCVELESRTK